MPQRASTGVEPLTKPTVSKNMASLGCRKSTTGVPTSHPSLRHLTHFSVPHSAPSPQSYTPAAAPKQGSNESHARLSRAGHPSPPSQGSLPHPGGSGIQPAVQLLSPPPDGEASWDTGLLEVRVSLSPTRCLEPGQSPAGKPAGRVTGESQRSQTIRPFPALPQHSRAPPFLP